MQYRFPRTYGQEEAKQRLIQALSQNRFPHALLLYGEKGWGQHALLLDLAQILICRSEEIRPCGKCSHCRLFLHQGLETIQYLIPLEKKEKETERDSDEPSGLSDALIEELSEGMGRWHGNPSAFEVSEKAIVRVVQVRDLLERLAYAVTGNVARIVLVPFLESLNIQSANAMLKTLEEPNANVYFLLGSENRSTLLPTVLSRCFLLGLTPLPQNKMLEFFQNQKGEGDEDLSLLLPLAEGSPGVLLAFRSTGQALLDEATLFLTAAIGSDWRSFLDYVSESTSMGLDDSSQLLLFLLRCARLQNTLRMTHPGSPKGRQDGFHWTAEALKANGWNPALAGHIGPLEEVSQLTDFVFFLEESFKAIQANCKPQTALLGLFLEYAAKAQARINAMENVA